LHVVGWGVVISSVLGGTSGSAFRDAPLLGAIQGALGGAINAVIVIGAISSAEIFLRPTRLGDALERAPFLVTFAVKLLVYGSVIALVVGGRPGPRLAAIGAASVLGSDLAWAIYGEIKDLTAHAMAMWLFGVGVAIFVLQMGRLIGYRTLGDILFGRYHRPRTEERFFLFIDIAGSTPLAERVGSAMIHRFLSEIFRVASPPIDNHGGEVYQYVGDEIVITWLVAEGRGGAQPLACFFAVEQALQRKAAAVEREFGAMPRLRAALHAGPVVTGEVGGSRRAIVFHGDVMNTTARLEQATRELDRHFLVSGDALERLEDLGGFAFEDLGLQRLRGRAAALHMYAVTMKPPTKRRETGHKEPGPSDLGMQPTTFDRG
jgi:adenylate cyclase